MKRVYVFLIRSVRSLMVPVGGLSFLDRLARRSRTGAWLRSLLAIYDIHDLIALDTPWWTYDSAARVEEHLLRYPGATVFEWGSGASTAWLAKRAGHVIAIEHDAAWAEKVRPLLGDNVMVRTVHATHAAPGQGVRSSRAGHEDLDFTDYVHAIDDYPGPFDLVVVDGRAREACLRRALPRLAVGGLLVFDNVDRARYREALDAEAGIDVTVTRGLTPSLPYPTRTALITRTPRT